MSPTIKNSILGVGILLFFGGAWFILQELGVIGSSDGGVQVQAVTQTREFRNILNDLNSISIDRVLLQDDDFLKMEDHTLPISDRELGRSNPFMPIE
jgi:hypothetical protein